MKAVFSLPVAFVLASSFGLAHAADATSKTSEKSLAKPVAATTSATTAAMGDATTGRNWNRIDTNRDNLISPEEMEAYLNANPGPLRGK